MLRYLRLTPNKEATIFALGLTTIYILGVLALVVSLLAVIWLAFQTVLLILTSVVECCSTIGALYNSADPLVRLLIIFAAGTAVYRIARKYWRRTTK